VSLYLHSSCLWTRSCKYLEFTRPRLWSSSWAWNLITIPPWFHY
jgi:hypothetical protein